MIRMNAWFLVFVVYRHSRKPLLSWTLWEKNHTRTALLSCNCWGTILLFGLQMLRSVHLFVFHGSKNVLALVNLQLLLQNRLIRDIIWTVLGLVHAGPVGWAIGDVLNWPVIFLSRRRWALNVILLCWWNYVSRNINLGHDVSIFKQSYSVLKFWRDFKPVASSGNIKLFLFYFRLSHHQLHYFAN